MATAICDDCKERVSLTPEGIARKHELPGAPGSVCPGSGLRPLDVGGGGVWEVSGGQFESNRRKH